MLVPKQLNQVLIKKFGGFAIKDMNGKLQYQTETKVEVVLIAII